MTNAMSACVTLIKTLGFAAILLPISLSASAQEVLGIYIQEKIKFGITAGSNVKIKQYPHVIFKNGEVFTKIDVPLEDLNIAASKQAEPDRWGTWRKEGKQIFFSMPDGEKKVKIYRDPAQPTKQDERLDGVWELQNYADGADGFSAVAVTNLIFFPDGRFGERRFRGASGADGSGSDTGVVVSSKGAATIQGTYRLSGYTAELTYNDGRVERMLAYFYADKADGLEREWLVLDGNRYQRQTTSTAGLDVNGQAPAREQLLSTAADSPTLQDGCPGGDAQSCTAADAARALEEIDQALAGTELMLRQKCDDGSVQVCIGAAQMYALGEGVDQNYGQAISFLQKACDIGSEDGCEKLRSLRDAQ